MGRLKDSLESGKFTVTCEIAPPKGTDISHIMECIDVLKGKVDAVNVTDFQSAVVRSTSLVTCKILKDNGIEPVLQMTGRDRNRIAIQGELLSAGVFGITNMLALTGDHTIVGDHPQAKPVFDLDCVGILKTAQKLSQGTDMVGNQLKGAPSFYLGASVTPRYTPIEIQLLKMKKKINAGAKFFQTQAVYDIDTMREFRKHTKDMNTKVLAGIIPLKSPGMAKFMNANVPGIYVPDELIERLRAVGKENWVSEGIKIAGELIQQLRNEDLCDGVHIMAIGAEENVPAILDAANI